MKQTISSKPRVQLRPILLPEPQTMHRMLRLALDLTRMPASEPLRSSRLVLGLMELLHARIGLWCRFQLGEGAALSCSVPTLLADSPERTRVARRWLKPLAITDISHGALHDMGQTEARSSCLRLSPPGNAARLQTGEGLCSILRHGPRTYSALQFYRPDGHTPLEEPDRAILVLMHSAATGWHPE